MSRAPPTRTLVLAQSGGPTAVMNASLVGALEAARSTGISRVLGARYGVEGLAASDFVQLDGMAGADLQTLARTPGAALGSSRHRPTDEEIEAIVGRLDEDSVAWVCMIGGNDSAETLHRLHLAANNRNLGLRVVGIPKTIDNDLPGMDHCLGYGSAARYLALAAREAALDSAAMRKTDPIKVLEVMGRNAGWLAAATALGREHPGDGPQVIFFPERPRPMAQMVEEIRAAYRAYGWALAVVSDNQRTDMGEPLSAGAPVYVDPHGNAHYESPAAHLAARVQAELGVRARHEIPGSLQRTARDAISEVDAREAGEAGAEAVRRAVAGESDVMVAIRRRPVASYEVEFGSAPLADIAHHERRMPDEFIAASGTDVTEAFVEYARPLIGGPLPAVLRLV